LSGDVVGVHQGLLAPYQLQLVGGSLMLNKSRRASKAVAVASNVGATAREHELFVPSTVHDANCQAQVLRFMASPDAPGSLRMFRIPVYSTDGSLYEAGNPDGLTLYYDTP